MMRCEIFAGGRRRRGEIHSRRNGGGGGGGRREGWKMSRRSKGKSARIERGLMILVLWKRMRTAA